MSKSGLVLISVDDLLEAPENDELYRPIQHDDPDIFGLADSIRRYGLREPLVITKDRYIHPFGTSPLCGLPSRRTKLRILPH
jgi:hypothetical protein